MTAGPDTNGFDYYYCHAGSLDMAPYVYVENGKVTAQPDRETHGTDAFGWWRKGLTGADFQHEDVLDNFTGRAEKYITERAASGTPFFLYLPLPAPHTPILPTGKFVGASKTNPYGDFVLQLDDCIGRVARAIDAAGIKDTTLLVVTSDNGCSPCADFPGLAACGHNPSHVFRGHKADIFEGGHHIPLIVRWPDVVKPGSTCADTTCLTDLLATCADIMGEPLPDTAGEDSFSMLQNLQGTARKPLREATVHHSVNGSYSIRQGRWKLEFCPGSGGWSDPKPGSPQEEGLPPVQLYDLEADIGERTNLQAAHPDVVARLAQLMNKYIADGRSTPGVSQKNHGTMPLMKMSQACTP